MKNSKTVLLCFKRCRTPIKLLMNEGIKKQKVLTEGLVNNASVNTNKYQQPKSNVPIKL